MLTSRIIGQYKGPVDGPMLIFTAGIHGNETSGVQALKEVFDTLETSKPAINGSIIGIASNLKALEKEVRYIQKDLNRIWLTDEEDPGISEFQEREEMIKILNEVISFQEMDICIVDLHSTSSESPPFIMLSDTLRNRELGRMAGVPMILGLMEHLQGMLIEATSRSGFSTLLFQGGRNGDEDTVIHHKGLIWKLLNIKCSLDTSKFTDCDSAINKLNRFAPEDKEHEFFEITYSHKIKAGVEFTVCPGYDNFQNINKNEVVAIEDGEAVKLPHGGQIFLPLYQDQGAEGFYIVKPIASFWIKLSGKFRLFKYHHKLHWLAGVKKINSNPLIFKIDLHITFLWVEEIFHLLGYIKVKQDGRFLFMTRREDERNPPTVREAIKQFTTKSYLRSELKNIKTDWRIPFSKA